MRRGERGDRVVGALRSLEDDAHVVTLSLAAAHDGAPLWVVTSDRELRGRVGPYADRVIGGGSFVGSL